MEVLSILEIKHTRVVHAHNADAGYGPNHSVRCIASKLQNLDPDMTADVTLRSHGTQFAIL